AGVVLEQAPAAVAFAEDGPAAVGQAAEDAGGDLGEAEEAGDGYSGGAAVGDHDEGAAGGDAGQGLLDRFHCAFGDLGFQFAAAAALVVVVLAPGRVLVRELGLDLLVRQALPGADVRLPQAFRQLH